ncbi:MAG: hypothetical protein AAGG50_17480 [Bacteroidota bacterium]
MFRAKKNEWCCDLMRSMFEGRHERGLCVYAVPNEQADGGFMVCYAMQADPVCKFSKHQYGLETPMRGHPRPDRGSMRWPEGTSSGRSLAAMCGKRLKQAEFDDRNLHIG